MKNQKLVLSHKDDERIVDQPLETIKLVIIKIHGIDLRKIELL